MFYTQLIKKDKVLVLSRINEKLIDLLCEINSNNQIFFLFDGLDDGIEFRKNKFYKYILLSLIQAIEDIKEKSINFSFHFSPYIAIRSDIFNSLKDSNLNKLDSNILQLKWGKNEILHLAVNRIKSKYKTLNKLHASWLKLCENNFDRHDKHKLENFELIFNKSLNKPRNFLKYLKICQENEFYKARDEKLSKDNILYCERDYSNWLYEEFDNETSGLLPIFETCMNVFREKMVDVINTNDYIDIIDSYLDIQEFRISNKVTNDKIIESLFNYGVIGCSGNLGSTTWVFSGGRFINKSKNICLNPGLVKKLGINLEFYPIRYNLKLMVSDQFTQEYIEVFENEVDIMIEKGHFRNALERMSFQITIYPLKNFPKFSDITITANLIDTNKELIKDIHFFCNKKDPVFIKHINPFFMNSGKYGLCKLVSDKKVVKPNHNSKDIIGNCFDIETWQEKFSEIEYVDFKIEIIE